ncbi:hypothetical protein DNL40_06890 [Xylanimonas oleitrophica]|uniref:Uncharacterized protein n=1 Tax=Xylanimonas oleitrophica TaxID=2607479 RepID=A0A2W5WTB7_9MICO|nr:hypothetical protein [Xylanimonas oleitrophica]PZR53833.1 hypothetical protein DNL40_06890 [Xylanimonas oleitrophica]
MTATLPWLAHLARHELEMLVTELARDLEQRPPSVEKHRAEAGLGCWRVVAETYGSVADVIDGPADDQHEG